MKGNVNNRAKNLTAQELRDLTMPPDAIAAANLRHDLTFGREGERIAWRTAYEPAAPGGCSATPEQIWNHHRSQSAWPPT